MKYSNTAITQMNRWYKSILKKCAIFNAAVIAGTALLAAPANAYDDSFDNFGDEGFVDDSCGSCWMSDGAENNIPEGLMPSSSPIIQAVVVTTLDNMLHGVGEHLGNPSAGLSSGDVLSGVTLWGDAYASKFDMENSRKMRGFDGDGHGALIGLDKVVGDNFKFGAGFQYDQTDVDADSRDINVKTKGGFVYGEYAVEDWFVNLVAAYSHSDFSEKKHSFGETYIARYDVDTYSAQAMTGYHFETEYSVVTPQAGLRYSVSKREAYEDGADQKAVKGNIDIMTAIAGIDIKSRSCSALKPEAHANLTYDIMSDHGDYSVVTLDNKSYSVEGKRLPRFGADLGVGISYDLGDWNFGLSYDLGVRKDFVDHNGMLKVQYSF